jgi:hypothetical protein
MYDPKYHFNVSSQVMIIARMFLIFVRKIWWVLPVVPDYIGTDRPALLKAVG